jgi:hypothetical protein
MFVARFSIEATGIQALRLMKLAALIQAASLARNKWPLVGATSGLLGDCTGVRRRFFFSTCAIMSDEFAQRALKCRAKEKLGTLVSACMTFRGRC